MFRNICSLTTCGQGYCIFFKPQSLSVRHLNVFSGNEDGNCIDVRKNSPRISPKKTSVSPPNIPLTTTITLYHKQVLKRLE